MNLIEFCDEATKKVDKARPSMLSTMHLVRFLTLGCFGSLDHMESRDCITRCRAD